MAMNEERINGVCAIMFKDQWAEMPKMQQYMVKEQVMKILTCNDEYNRLNGIMEIEMDPTLFELDKEDDGKKKKLTLLDKVRKVGNELYIFKGDRRVILEAANEIERLQGELDAIKETESLDQPQWVWVTG